MAYIDSSVMVACYCPEPRAVASQEAVQSDGEPVISPLVALEVQVAIAVKLRRGEFDEGAASSMVAEFRRRTEAGAYRIIPLTSAEYDLAGEWVRGFRAPLRAPDAIHLAAASNHGLAMVTADRALAAAAAQFGVKCQFIP